MRSVNILSHYTTAALVTLGKAQGCAKSLAVVRDADITVLSVSLQRY